MKCQAYLNPFVEFMQGNEQWKCNICQNVNEVMDYYNITEDENELNKKPELNSGTYEFISYKNTLRKEGPSIISYNYYFLIDISFNAIKY